MTGDAEIGSKGGLNPPGSSPGILSGGTLVSPSLLDEEHFQEFHRALLNILSTDLAEFNHAQILDGLPTVKSFKESYDYMKGHPVYELDHTKLCPGSLGTARESSCRT